MIGKPFVFIKKVSPRGFWGTKRPRREKMASDSSVDPTLASLAEEHKLKGNDFFKSLIVCLLCP